MYRPVLSCQGLLAMYLLKGAPPDITPPMNKVASLLLMAQVPCKRVSLQTLMGLWPPLLSTHAPREGGCEANSRTLPGPLQS